MKHSPTFYAGISFLIIAIYFCYSIYQVFFIIRDYRRDKELINKELYQTFGLFIVITFTLHIIQAIITASAGPNEINLLILPVVGSSVKTPINLNSLAFDIIALNMSRVFVKYHKKEEKRLEYYASIVAIFSLIVLSFSMTIFPMFS